MAMGIGKQQNLGHNAKNMIKIWGWINVGRD